jgi:hypothetical protein
MAGAGSGAAPGAVVGVIGEGVVISTLSMVFPSVKAIDAAAGTSS